MSETRQQKILLIDDQPDVHLLVKGRLSDMGAEIVSAYSAQEGLRLVREQSFDLILLDYMLPDCDGLTVCRTLKKDPLSSRVPVIFLTVIADDQTKVAAFDAGAADYVTKPFAYPELRARVRSALRNQQLIAELDHRATTDILTGLANRALFLDRLEQAIQRARRVKGYHYAVLFIDFDRFKLINDSMGHPAGDELLVQIGQRLRATVRGIDSVCFMDASPVPARLAGDEFVLLLDGLCTVSDANLIAERLLVRLAEPFRVQGSDLFCTASIGVATSTQGADSALHVLRDADTAMYEAKLAGRSRAVTFDESMLLRAQHRLRLETDLRQALANNQLQVHYQPIVSLTDAGLHGFEALLRWTHPQHGSISPAEFIPIAEETGMIIPIGEWVLREACRQFVQWQRDFPLRCPVSVAVNLSRNQLMLPDLAERVQTIIRETNINPGALHLEVTESAVMKDIAFARNALAQLQKLGVTLCMDDFGTGYSSLSCLHEFPFKVLKIDRSFVANLTRGRDFCALVQTIVTLAGNLGMTVVAEGVETNDQVATLQAMDCQYGQGYLFGRPAAPADLAFTKNETPRPGLNNAA
ncbi:MAG: EAL domain-containing protein [Planctomycetes bacterium]|nr:EAL domain-containing protein [Planctomycetota bacterium]